MDGRDIEPRTVIWAVAEVSWQDSAGKPVCERATLEDTSRSGACIRLKAPLQIGARIHVRWHREQFSAIARNCRRDGRDFLLGVLRDPTHLKLEATTTVAKDSIAHHAPEDVSIARSEGKVQPTEELPRRSNLAPTHQPAVAERKLMEPKA